MSTTSQKQKRHQSNAPKEKKRKVGQQPIAEIISSSSSSLSISFAHFLLQANVFEQIEPNEMT
jgi:hypothetical protein